MPRGNPIELSFEVFGMQKWNIPTDEAQRVDQKNGVMCLSCFLMMMRGKNQSQFRQSIKCICLIYLFYNILWIIGFWDIIGKVSTYKKAGFKFFL